MIEELPAPEPLPLPEDIPFRGLSLESAVSRGVPQAAIAAARQLWDSAVLVWQSEAQERTAFNARLSEGRCRWQPVYGAGVADLLAVARCVHVSPVLFSSHLEIFAKFDGP